MSINPALFFRSLGLRARLMVFATLTALPTLAAVIAAGNAQRHNATTDAEKDALSLARHAAGEHRSLVIETRYLLSLLAKQPEVIGMSEAQCGKFMSRFMQHDERYANFGTIDSQGKLVCSATPVTEPVNVADRPVFRRVLETQRFTVGDYVIGRITQAPVLVFAYPIVDEQNQVKGAAFAALSLRWLQRLVSAADLPPNSRITVIDRHRNVLARFPDDDQWNGKSIAGTPLDAALSRTTTDNVERLPDLSGTDKLFGISALYGDLDTPEAYIAVGLDVGIALAEPDAMLQRNLTVVAALLILLFASAWWGSSLFVLRPLRQLVILTGELERGNMTARAPVYPGNHELSRLYRAYNRMADALQNREQEIQRHANERAALNRIHAILSASNAAVLRVDDRQRLLEEICRIAVDEGQFQLAWVAEAEVEIKAEAEIKADADTHHCHALAWAGTAEATMRELCSLVSEAMTTDSQVPAQTALFEDHHAAATTTQLQSEALQRWFFDQGIGTWAAFPLRIKGRSVACLNLCGRQTELFDQQEMALLQTVAADASFGLEYLEKERHRNYLSYYDALTDLPNRLLFLDQLERRLRWAHNSNQSIAVLVIGLRGLRRINDTLGRRVGDAVLTNAARELREKFRDIESLARLGNDEFGAILDDAKSVALIGEIANQVLQAAPKRIHVDGHEVYVEWNGGVALFPSDASDAHSLVKCAELASHSAAKSDGSTLLFYSPHMDTQARHRYEVETRLRDAARRGELFLHYQPVVDIHTGEALSVEALLRWNSPELGALSAAGFIPVAEETGLINSIGDWVMEQACQQVNAWRVAGLRAITVALNLSVKQLQQPQFAEHLIATLKAADCDPASVPFAIEITESELMRNVKSTAEVLTQLKQAGFAIYVDDFGTGYSSLSYLQQLPIDVLKIDRSFVQDLTVNGRTHSMIKAIVSMAHNLGLRVIAEGVENHAELAQLRDLGCDAVQGYLLSMPCAAHDIERILSTPLIAAQAIQRGQADFQV